MVSLNQLAYDALKVYRDQSKKTDTLPIEQVKYWINNIVRPLLVSQGFSRNYHEMSEVLYQDLGVIELEKVDTSKVAGFKSDEEVYRTKVAIPATFRDKGLLYTIRVSDPLFDGGYYTQSSNRNFRFCNKGFYKDKAMFFTVNSDRKLYFKGDMPGYVSIDGLFEDANLAALYINPSHTDDDEYPITGEMISDLMKIVKKDDVTPLIMQLEDKINNGTNDIVNL